MAKSSKIPPKTYFATSEGNWKKNITTCNHTKSFKNLKYSKETNLSRILSDLKNKNIPAPQLQWSIEKNVPAYSHISKRCLLCLHKMFALITFKRQDNLLNKRSESGNKCRHENMFLSNNYKSKDWFCLSGNKIQFENSYITELFYCTIIYLYLPGLYVTIHESLSSKLLLCFS